MTYLSSDQKTKIRFHFAQAGIIYSPQKLDEDFDGISYIATALTRCEWAYGQTTSQIGNNLPGSGGVNNSGGFIS